MTNRPLIDDGYTAMRINTKDGGLDYRETDRFAWKSAFEDDLSVLPIRLDEHHGFRAVQYDMYVTPEAIENYKIGSGDDVVMVGRFINRDGVQQNSPSVRFGNISTCTARRWGICGDANTKTSRSRCVPSADTAAPLSSCCSIPY